MKQIFFILLWLVLAVLGTVFVVVYVIGTPVDQEFCEHEGYDKASSPEFPKGKCLNIQNNSVENTREYICVHELGGYECFWEID